MVCFDETSKQLVADKRPAIGAKPGRVERYDYEYKRNGTRNLFMSCEPMRGFRHVEVRASHCCGLRSSDEVAVDEAYPDAKVIRLVLDNLNTHKDYLRNLRAGQPCVSVSAESATRRTAVSALEKHQSASAGATLFIFSLNRY